jgi:very-short-patch-repair endonuclease
MDPSDHERTRMIESLEFRVLPFRNIEVYKGLKEVTAQIEAVVGSSSRRDEWEISTPSPPSGGRGPG